MKDKIILGMSGGVDSAVAAYLLQKEGYEVIAVHFSVQKNTLLEKEIEDCRKIAQKLQIHFYSVSLEKEFQKKIISYYLEEYEKGRTPSPCPWCDDLIKFHFLFEERKKWGALYVATGHYSKITFVKKWNLCLLEQSHFIEKDQSYMLYRLSPEKLKHIRFPLTNLEKKEVRELAQKIPLSVAGKKDSQGICFVPEGYQNFLKKHLSHKIQEGYFLDEEGNILGQHKGYPFYTLGQRRGLGLSTKEILFVTKINVSKNEITLGKFESLLKQDIKLIDTVLHLPFDSLKDLTLLARPRFSSRGFLGKLVKKDGIFHFIYEEKNTHNAPGQHVVLFYQNYLIGGGIIE